MIPEGVRRRPYADIRNRLFCPGLQLTEGVSMFHLHKLDKCKIYADRLAPQHATSDFRSNSDFQHGIMLIKAYRKPFWNE